LNNFNGEKQEKDLSCIAYDQTESPLHHFQHLSDVGKFTCEIQ